MPRLRIPTTGKWIGIREGEFAGNFWLTKNISLERNKGKISLGESYTGIFTETDDAQLTTPVAFVRTGADGTDRWWALGGSLFRTTNTDPETGWAENTASPAGAPTTGVYDMIEFQDALLVALETDIARLSTTWDVDWWTDVVSGTALTTGKPHRFSIHAGAVLVTDGNLIHTWDGTTVSNSALILPQDYEAQFILTTADVSYICANAIGDRQEAAVFAWDRTTGADYNALYPVGDRIILAGFIVGGIPHIITKKGAIMRFTGQGFVRVQQFPSYEIGVDIAEIHPNGVVVEENIVKILVRFGISTSFTQREFRLLDGIWTFDTSTNNLYHSGSLRDDSGNDYSQQELLSVGAMVKTAPTQGRYLVGGKAYQIYPGTTEEGIFTSDEASSANRGYFITTKIRARDVKGFWSSIQPLIRRLKNSTDRVRLAYQTRESNALPSYYTITWASTTTFTFTAAAATDPAVGDFVEVLAGPNAGLLAKITALTGTTTLTATIDLTVNSSTDTARARFLPFKDLGTISSQSIQTEIFRIAQRDGWIRFICELRGDEESPEVEGFITSFSNKKL